MLDSRSKITQTNGIDKVTKTKDNSWEEKFCTCCSQDGKLGHEGEDRGEGDERVFMTTSQRAF